MCALKTEHHGKYRGGNINLITICHCVFYVLNCTLYKFMPIVIIYYYYKLMKRLDTLYCTLQN